MPTIMGTKPSNKSRAAKLIERKGRDDFQTLREQFGDERAKRFMSIEEGAEKASKRPRIDEYGPADDEFVEL